MNIDHSDVSEAGLASWQAEVIAAVTSIISRVLEKDVGQADDIFELGGTSLAAAKIAARLTGKYGRLLSVADVLRNRTPEAIAGILTNAPYLTPAGSHRDLHADATELELTPAQRWYHNVHEKMLPHATFAFCVTIPEAVTRTEVRKALVALACRHDALRTTISWSRTPATQRVLDAPAARRILQDANTSSPVVKECDLACDEHQLSETLADIAAREMEAGILDETRPPVKMVLASWRDRQLYLLIIAHHLIFDGPSEGIFVRDLMALLDGQESALPPAGSCHVTPREPDSGTESSKRLRAWWKQYLEGAGQGCHLARKNHNCRTYGWSADWTIPPSITVLHNAKARKLSIPVSIVRLAATIIFAHALYARDDISILMHVDGRDDPRIADAIGMFIQPAVLRNLAADGEEIDAFLVRVYDNMLSVVERGSIGLDSLVALSEGVSYENGFPFSGLIHNGEELESIPGPPMREPVVSPLARPIMYDIQLYFISSPDRLDMSLTHRAEVIDQEAGVALLRIYIEILKRLLASNDGRAADLIAWSRSEVESIMAHG